MGDLENVAVELFNIGAIKFGKFITKVGIETPIYIDLRLIISYPKLLAKISNLMWNLIDKDEKFEHLCGVPYTALPIATAMSLLSNKSMLIRRKEVKSYGTKKVIEGVFNSGDQTIIIEDLITSGTSILETIRDLKNEGLLAKTAVIIVDREQGGRQNLKNHGVEVKSLFTMTEILNILLKSQLLNEETVNMVLDFINLVKAPLKIDERLSKDFASRAKMAKHPLSAKLLNLMSKKKTTLCLAADVVKSDEVLELANIAGPHIAVLKIHVDILEDFSLKFIEQLQCLSEKHNFLIMEDRKFADIGQIVGYQYSKGIYHIGNWAHFVTVHSLPGNGIIQGIESNLSEVLEDKGIFLVAQMSSQGTLTNQDYITSTVSLAKKFDVVVGFVCQKNIFSDPGLIQLTPGVMLNKSTDKLGQQYNTPEEVVNSGADLVVVGRGITQSNDQLKAVMEYKKVLWKAYETRITCDEI